MAEISPSATPFRVLARDENLQVVADLESMIRFTASKRFNGVGAWSCTIAADAPGAATLSAVGSRRGVIVQDDTGRVVFSGPLTRVARSGDGVSDVLELSGACDNALLARRVILPDPAGPPYTAASHDVRTGLADAIMAQYVEVTMGVTPTGLGHPERSTPGLIIPDVSGLGTSGTWRARFDNLLEMCQQIATPDGLRFEIQQYDLNTGLVKFSVTRPADKSAVIVFDPGSGTLRARTLTEASPGVTLAIAAGQGEGAARAFVERSAPDDIARYGLRQVFRDARDTADAAILGQRADETLKNGRSSLAVDLDAIDTGQVRYGRDYDLGDRVATSIRYPDGTLEQTQGYVTEITLVIDEQTAAEGGTGMIRPTIETVAVARTDAGQLERGGGLAGYLARNGEDERERVGTVKLWAGAIADIPPRWQLMDGTGGTTDMRGRFLVGADGNVGSGGAYPLFSAGGAQTHTHGVTLADHVHTAVHDHTFTVVSGAPSATTINLATITPQQADAGSATHTHTSSGTVNAFSGNTGAAGAASLTSGATDGRPPYKALFFIQRIAA